MNKKIIFVILFLSVIFSYNVFSEEGINGKQNEHNITAEEIMEKEAYQEYLNFFEEVYKMMDENYYHPLNRESYNKFLHVFDSKIYEKVKSSKKSINYIKWRSSAYLVDYLKASDDKFTAFFPPKAAKNYEEEVLGKKIDLGIEGSLIKEGYKISKVEPRADAYGKGLREEDIIIKIDSYDVSSLSDKEIQEKLTPLENTVVVLTFLSFEDGQEKVIDVISKEYFKKFVFMIPVDVPGVFCIQIQRFNRKTSEDMTRYMSYIMNQGDSDLIIDLRGNPGGPPLAAREISAFFLPPEEDFAYFKRKNKPNALLTVPKIPDDFHYKGKIVLLVDNDSGSAAELFSGIMQNRKRAVVMGVNTAGQVLLKSMFHFDDDSMLLLVTARGHFPDGKVFSYDGVTPDQYIDKEEDALIKYAAEYLYEMRGN